MQKRTISRALFIGLIEGKEALFWSTEGVTPVTNNRPIRVLHSLTIGYQSDADHGRSLTQQENMRMQCHQTKRVLGLSVLEAPGTIIIDTADHLLRLID